MTSEKSEVSMSVGINYIKTISYKSIFLYNAIENNYAKSGMRFALMVGANFYREESCRTIKDLRFLS